jgi:rod shape-determining protein MreD
MRIGADNYRQRAEHGLQSIIPSVVTFCLTLISVIPYGVPELNKAMPFLPLISIFFWCIHCPTLCPILFSFVLGVLQDSLAGTPIGFSSAMYLCMHAFVGYQHPFFHDKNFFVLWCVFSALLAVIVLVGYLILGFYHFSVLPFAPVLIQLLVTIAVYPFLTRLLQGIMRYIMHRG